MKKLQKGFTLVELMIVVAIIAVLAAVALPSFGQQIKKSKDGKAVQMLGSMRSQLGMVQADLDGANPPAETDNLKSVFEQSAGNTVTAADGTTATSKGIQGFTKLGAITGDTGGTINVGTAKTTAGTKVNWNYSVTNGTIQFNDAATVLDTKDKPWANY